MSLLDRLRPRWQSADAEVRAEAVRELDRSEVDLLTAVAQQDQDPRVRRIAVKKLDSPRLLLELAETDEDPGLRSFARRRARQLLVQIACDGRDLEESKRALSLLAEASDHAVVVEKARFPELRRNAFDALQGDEAFLELLRRSKDAALRAQALQRIEAPHSLKKVVLEDSSGDLALAALSRIDDLEVLEAIVEQHTVPKAVRRQAFAKLERMVPASHPIKARERQERYLEICQSAEALADSRLPSALAELPELQRSWSAIESEGAPEPRIVERFRAAVERLQSIPAPAPEPESASGATASEPVSDPRLPQLVAIAERLESLETLEKDALLSGIDESVSAWEELAREGGPVEAGLAARFRDALSGARDRLQKGNEEQALASEAAALVERAEKAAREPVLEEASRTFRELNKELARLSGFTSPQLADRFREAAAWLEVREREAKALREQAEAANLADLEARISRMEALLSAEELSLKEADRELREAQELLRTMGALPKSVNRKKARRRLMEARERLFKSAHETRQMEEWKRWANADIQEALIGQVEKLRETNDLPKVAKELRRIHEEWKKAAAAPQDKAQELWEQYKLLRDEQKARCDEFFAHQGRLRTENLAKKEALCLEVEALQDSEEWNRTADAIKALQVAWKKIGPVPPESSEAVWKRFRAACDHFFERRKSSFDRLKTEREENLSRKEALIARVEALKSSTDWQTTANEIKRLQTEWREIGAVPKKKSDEIWSRFRGACDFFFDRYKRRDQVENEERVQQRELLIGELSVLSPGSGEEPRAIAARVQDVWSRWKKLGAVPPDSAELMERFETRMGELLLGLPGAFAGSELDPQQSRKKREKICERLESIVEELDGGKPPAEPLEDLAQRLKDALASNTISGGRRQEPRLDWHAASDEVARLRSNFLRAAPVPGEEGRALLERLDKACRSFYQLRPARHRASSPGASISGART